MLRLVFLGKFRPLAPPSLDAVEPPPGVGTLKELCDWLAAEVPALGAALAVTPFKLIVDHAVAHDLSARLNSGEEIAFMPPMSGG
jgi:molybdopterin converting factor small subunit